MAQPEERIATMEAQQPQDATASYRSYNGEMTWIKDLDARIPNYQLAYVWSHTTKRWRSKRERIVPERISPVASS